MKRLLHWLHRTEDAVIIGILCLMIVPAVLQIVLRNFFGIGITWIDPLLQNAVLWIGMLGAMIASREGGHIRIDLVSRFVSQTMRCFVAATTHLFTASLCGLMAWYSFQHVQEEAAFGGMAFAQVPSWWLQTIIPVGFALISLRFALRFVLATAGRERTSASDEAMT